MTILTLIWIIIILFSIAILTGLTRLVYQKGKDSTQENPEKGIIFTLNGRHLEKPQKAKLIRRSSKATHYSYNNKNSVLVPNVYQEIYYRDRRLIFMANKGRLISNDFSNEITLSDTEKETLIKEILKADIGGGAIRAIQSTHPIALNIVMVIIALAIGAIGTYGFIQVQKQMALNNQPQTQQSQQSQPKIQQDVK